MNRRKEFCFDDRALMTVGIPTISFIVVFFFFQESPQENGWGNFLFSWFISALYTTTYWIITRWVISSWRRKYPGNTNTYRRIISTIVSIIICVVLIEALCHFSFGFEQLFGVAQHHEYGILKTGPISVVLVATMTGIYEAIYFFSLFRKSEIDKERLLRTQVENQLDSLRKQVDPHFLFNSLNTLVAIIPEDPKAAQEFTERLSSTYRRLLQWQHKATVTLSEELESLEDYLHLLEVRYENRLEVIRHIEDSCLECFIAPLSLQMLVENAVKHNEASIAHPLVVTIQSNGTSITISNSKRLKNRDEIKSMGFGLENLADRVKYLSDQQIIIEDNEKNFSVTIPLLEMAPTTTTMLSQTKS